MSGPNLNDNERKVLRALVRVSWHDGAFANFQMLTRSTKLRRNEVRLACRSLARKGLARYARGLWYEDKNAPAGSGYCATRAGGGLV
jgi:hypothetical protein